MYISDDFSVTYGYFTELYPVLKNINAGKFMDAVKKVEEDIERCFSPEYLDRFIHVMETYEKDRKENEESIYDMSILECLEYIPLGLNEAMIYEDNIGNYICAYIDLLSVPSYMLTEYSEKSYEYNSNVCFETISPAGFIGIPMMMDLFQEGSGRTTENIIETYRNRDMLKEKTEKALKPFYIHDRDFLDFREMVIHNEEDYS